MRLTRKNLFILFRFHSYIHKWDDKAMMVDERCMNAGNAGAMDMNMDIMQVSSR